jgi:hypothetical protein
VIAVIISALVVVAGVIGAVLWQRRRLIAALPPRQDCANSIEALNYANIFANVSGGIVLAVAGTGSMAPYIRGGDPTGVVAYVVTNPHRCFAQVEIGELCSYHPESDPTANWLHQTAERDDAGWIMTGLANRQHENWMRMTAANFVGVIARTFTWNP